MSANLEYTVNFTDDSLKQPITVQPKTKNDTALSVVLYGYGTSAWGERTQENIVRLLENFASPNPPQNPTIGQLWYDSANVGLKVWTGTDWRNGAAFTGKLPPKTTQEGDLWYDNVAKLLKWWNGQDWMPIGSYNANTPPQYPYTGMIWLNTVNSKLYFWDGTKWCQIENDLSDVISSKVNRSGDTMTGMLSLSADPTSAMHAVTKQYSDSTFVGLAGSTMTGYLTLSANPASAMHAVTKQYVDTNFVNKSGGQMSGFLSLYADPVLPMQAATKQYTDTSIANFSNSAGSSFSRVNPAVPKDGDLKLTGTAIYVYMASIWRQIWPATYS